MWKRSRVAGAIFLLVISASGWLQKAHQDTGHSWTYGGEHGPQHWSELSPESAACGAGKTPSPIDITRTHPAQLPPLQFSYRASALKIIDNGHTIQIVYQPGSAVTIGDRGYEL